MFRTLVASLLAATFVLISVAAQSEPGAADRLGDDAGQRLLRAKGGKWGGQNRKGGKGGKGGKTHTRQFAEGTMIPDSCAGLVDTSYTLESWSKPKVIPVILLTRGRSGSTVFANTLENLMNGFVDTKYPLTKEFTNTYIQRSQIWLDHHCTKLKNHSSSDKEVLNPLVPLANSNADSPHAKLVGFKWKMLGDLTYPSVWSAFKKDGGKVVVMERNYLDWLISNAKHHMGSHLTSHCHDEKCAEETKSIHICLSAQKVAGGIATLDRQWDVFKDALDEAGVDYIKVWHKDMFYSDNRTEHWSKVLHFLGRTDAKVTEDMLMQAEAGFVVTSSLNQRGTLLNYDAVQEALQGSGFEHFLRSNDEPTPPEATGECTAANTH